MLRKFTEPARSCHLQPYLVCSPMRVYFHASQVRSACWLVPLVNSSGLLNLASLLLFFACSPSLLARSSCNLAESAHPCEFTFLLRKFAEPAPSSFLKRCRVDSPVRVYFHASQVRSACWLVPLVNSSGLLNLASLLLFFACSPSLLARSSCNLAESAHPCEFTFLLRKFAEPAPSSFLKRCRVCSPMRVYFHASQVRSACWLVPLVNSSGLLNLASLLLFFACLPSLLARSSCNLAESAHPCEFTFLLRKFAEPAPSSFLKPYSLVLLTTLSGLHTRASLLSSFASSPSLLGRATCNLSEYAHSCEFTFMLCKFAWPAGSCFLRPCRVCLPVLVCFHALQVRRAYSLVRLANLPGLLARASLLSCFASSPSLLARACGNLAESTPPCEFTFKFRKFAEFARSCFLRPWRVPLACSLVLLATLPSLLTCASLLSCFASSPRLLTRASLLSFFGSSPSLLARTSCDLAGSAHPSEFTFLLRKLAEPTGSSLLRPYRVCSPGLVYFHASQLGRACCLVPLVTLLGLLTRANLLSCLQVHRGCSLVLLATLPGLLTRASLHPCFASSLRLLARASYDLGGSAHPCEFSFMLRKFAEPVGSFSLRPCGVSSPMRAYFLASEFRRAYSLVLLVTLPGLLTCASLLSCFASSPSLLARATCDLTESSHLCEFTFVLRKFTEAARSCFLRPRRVCSPVRVYFHSSEVRRACWLVHLATLPSLLTRASLLSCLAS
ncbi:hypothetical protein CDL15_Pgr002556 [Punica granatum]|uniref:Uncharacterized protein n=1 Tax=Punica granatum TaxID=22663 RepID=A0A218XRI2_PUNGR|nr:hypothetical protein CDL15_Pgr002556 [Punica granatum]